MRVCVCGGGSPEAFRESAWDQAGHHPVSLPHFHPLGAWRASYNQRPRALSLGLLQGVVEGRVEGRGSVEEGREPGGEPGRWGGLAPLPALKEKESEVAQSCPTLCDPVNCSLPGSSIHGIFQTTILDWVAISFFLTQGSNLGLPH